jgi:hypothetical protein
VVSAGFPWNWPVIGLPGVLLSAPECRDSAVWAFLSVDKLIFLVIPGVPFSLRAFSGGIVSIQGWTGCFFIDQRYVALAPANRDSTDQSSLGIFSDQSPEFLRQNQSMEQKLVKKHCRPKNPTWNLRPTKT